MEPDRIREFAVEPEDDPYGLRCPSVILIPPGLSDRIDGCAAAAGIGRSEWIRQHLTLAVHESEQEQTATPIKRKARKRAITRADHYGRKAGTSDE